MNPTFSAAALILLSLVAPRVSAATPIEATLTLPHDHVLPGVPFDIVVTYTNVSDHPVTIGGAVATLVVTFASGETSVMNRPDVNDQWDLVPPTPLRLAPGKSVQLAASWDHGIPNWFIYESFSGPGTYGIALDLRIVDAYKEPLSVVRTGAVTLTRIEPVGIDAELWKRMQDISDGKWSDMSFQASTSGEALAAEIIQLHPASGYYPYVLALPALLRRDRGDIAALLEAAQRFPTSPAHPYLLFAAASSADYRALTAKRAGDTAEALKYFALAQSNYRAALATESIAVRDGAEKGLRDATRELDRATKKAR